MALTGRRVLLGITGGIAAYKAAELVRLLVKAGADVRVAMTEAASRFIGTTTMQALSGQPVWTDLWDARVTDAMGHIELSRDRELILVAPASADFMAKLAHGLCDDLLSTLCVARRCPLMVAPAMNVEMWQNAATQRSAETLRADGVQIVGPASGGQACGEMGMGRMTEPADILADVQFFFQQKSPSAGGSLRGRRVVVTAGPTEEPIDPARVITNILIFRVTPEAFGTGSNTVPRTGLTAAFLARAREHGVLATPVSEDEVRMVTHKDVDRKAIDAAIARLRQAFLVPAPA